jgi:hypothetical protein
MRKGHLLTYILAGLFSLSFPAMLAASSAGPDMALTLSSQKVPIHRNQLEIQFTASTGGGEYQGAFSAYCSQATLVSVQYPPSFWFSTEPFKGSLIFSFPADGLYQVFGNLYDFELLNISAPEDYEVDPFLTMASLFVKVIEGNAIEITEKQYRHEQDKDIRQKNENRALGRVGHELEYAQANLADFAIEEGEYAERYPLVENAFGLDLKADNGDLHQQLLLSEGPIKCPKCPIIKPFCLKYILDPLLNVAVTLNGSVGYEDPTGPVQCPVGGTCTLGSKPVKNQLIQVAVRSYVTVKCLKPFPPGGYFTFTTI